MDIKDLTEEQIEKAKACKTAEEFFALAKEEGIELSEEELDAMSGGVNWDCLLYNEDCADFNPCTSVCHRLNKL